MTSSEGAVHFDLPSWKPLSYSQPLNLFAVRPCIPLLRCSQHLLRHMRVQRREYKYELPLVALLSWFMHLGVIKREFILLASLSTGHWAVSITCGSDMQSQAGRRRAASKPHDHPIKSLLLTLLIHCSALRERISISVAFFITWHTHTHQICMYERTRN